MFGPEQMRSFREFKAIWDPDNRMNPGKLVDAVRVYDPIENLRHGPLQPTDGTSRLKGTGFSPYSMPAQNPEALDGMRRLVSRRARLSAAHSRC